MSVSASVSCVKIFSVRIRITQVITRTMRTQKMALEHRTEQNTKAFLTPEHRTEQNMKKFSTLEHRTEQNTKEKKS